MKTFTLPLLTIALSLAVHAQNTSIGCVVGGPGGSTVSCPAQPTVPVECIVPTGAVASLPAQCITLSNPPSPAVPTVCVSSVGGTKSCGPLSTDAGGTSTRTVTTGTITSGEPGPTRDPLNTSNTAGSNTGTGTGTTTGPTNGIPGPTGAAERLGANSWVAGGMVLAAVLF